MGRINYSIAVLGVIIGLVIIIAGLRELIIVIARLSEHSWGTLGIFVGVSTGTAILLLSIDRIEKIHKRNVEIQKTNALSTSSVTIIEVERPPPPINQDSRMCKKCEVEVIFKKEVHCPKCNTYYKFSPLCPRCNRVLKILGDVWWCDNCAGWIAPNDVKLVIGDEYKGLFSFLKKVIQEPFPLLSPPAKQVKYKSQFCCKACGHSFWVFEHRLKIPYCQECGTPDPIYVATVEQ